MRKWRKKLAYERKLRDAVVDLFRNNPWLCDQVIVIGGIAAFLRLESSNAKEKIRHTTDLDLAARSTVDVAQLVEALGSLKHNIILLVSDPSVQDIFNVNVIELITKDFDLLPIDGVQIPVVGPIGLLLSKLSRSGEEGKEYARGKDLADVIHVWISDPDLVKERYGEFKNLPGVQEAIIEFKSLMRDDYSKGTIAVLEELDMEPGDMTYMLLKAQLDALLSELE